MIRECVIGGGSNGDVGGPDEEDGAFVSRHENFSESKAQRYLKNDTYQCDAK